MDVYFSCTKCGQNMKIDSKYSGMTANCPNCQTELLIPITNETPPQQESETPPAIPQKIKSCPKCGTPLRSESAVLCIECGYNMNSGMVTATKVKETQSSTASSSSKDRKKPLGVIKGTGKFGLAVILAASAAIISGIIWGLIGCITNYELGYIAVLVGLITGGVFRLITTERSTRAGILAVLLAVCGILLGKFIMAHHFTKQNATLTPAELFDPGNIDIKKQIDDYAEAYGMYLIESGAIEDPETEMFNMVKAGADPESPEFASVLERMDDAFDDYYKRIYGDLSTLSQTEKDKFIKYYSEYFYLLFLYQIMIDNGELSPPPDTDNIPKDRELTPIERKLFIEGDLRFVEALPAVREKYHAMSEEDKKIFHKEIYESFATTKDTFYALFDFYDVLFFLLAIATAWGAAAKQEDSAS